MDNTKFDLAKITNLRGSDINGCYVWEARLVVPVAPDAQTVWLSTGRDQNMMTTFHNFTNSSPRDGIRSVISYWLSRDGAPYHLHTAWIDAGPHRIYVSSLIPGNLADLAIQQMENDNNPW